MVTGMVSRLFPFISAVHQRDLLNELLDTMFETRADFTNSFRKLSLLELNCRAHIAEDIEKYLKIILPECCGLAELKAFFKPKFPKE